MQVAQFDIEHIQAVADGCPHHPAYRVNSSIPDFSECQGCAKVFAAYSMLCVAGLLDFQQMAKAKAKARDRTLLDTLMSTSKKLRKAKFAQSADHLIHLIDGINSHHTICGDAFEGGVEWDEIYDPSGERAAVHLHPEPQSGQARTDWLQSGMSYTEWSSQLDINRKIQQLRNDGDDEFADAIETLIGQNTNMRHLIIQYDKRLGEARNREVADALAKLRAEYEAESDRFDSGEEE